MCCGNKYDGMNIIVNSNLITLELWSEDLAVKYSYKIVKWNALNDCALYIYGSGSVAVHTTINPETDIEEYFGGIKNITGYERPLINFDLH
jgi:hypothetical protein